MGVFDGFSTPGSAASTFASVLFFARRLLGFDLCFKLLGGKHRASFWWKRLGFLRHVGPYGVGRCCARFACLVCGRFLSIERLIGRFLSIERLIALMW